VNGSSLAGRALMALLTLLTALLFAAPVFADTPTASDIPDVPDAPTGSQR